jgi:TatD DNase family protein
MIDTHAHLYDPDLVSELEAVLVRAKSKGITQIWMPNCNSETIEPMLALSKAYPALCKNMLGLHPCYVKEDYEQELDIILSYLKDNPVIAIGEIGMDLYWDKTFVEQQKVAFTTQCHWAIERNIWVDIHCRNAFDETVECIQKINDARLKGIFHCFVGDYSQAQQAIELGFKLGIGGVLTFKNGGLDTFLKNIDIKHLVLETDASYLAPVPYRGKRNEPSYTHIVAEKMAQVYGISIEEVIEKTTENALSLLSN